MSVNMETLIIGDKYDRDSLCVIWGYKSRQAISRGIITPAKDNKIILFVTKIKQKADTQYNDYFIEEGLLHMEGESSHFNDQRLINAQDNQDSIYLFYRDIHHTAFTYYGKVQLVDYKVYVEKPSIFILATSGSLTISARNLSVEQNKTSLVDKDFIADKEGYKKVKIHVSYERSLKNRAKAIEIHGTTCRACGFDFDQFYGKDLAKQFIEIHHIIPLSKLKEGTSVDPTTDLVPLCSNCHSMIHRSRDTVMTVKEIQERIAENKKGVRS